MELRRVRLVVPLALALALADEARAVDGVIEIDALRAAAGGVTPGDAPGYPVTISAPGSYVLTGDLVVQDVTAIELTTGEVSLDLNGFGIRCASTCTTGDGVFAPVQGVIVRNGYVRGMGGVGILVSQRGLLVDLDASHNGGVGVSAGVGCRARSLRAEGNGSSGISCAGVVQDSLARENALNGIVVTHGVLARSESVSDGAAPSGIDGNGLRLSGGVAVGNVVDDAGLDGVRSQQQSLMLHNVISRSASRAVFHEGFGSLATGGNHYDDNGTNGVVCVIGASCRRLALELCAGSTACP